MSVLTLRPNADSTPLEQSGAAHYQNVDEETLNEADYQSCASGMSASVTDIYGFPDHTTESGTINSVTIKVKAKYTLTGTCTNNATVDPAIKIDSTVYYSGAQNLTDSTAEYTYTWATNPATSSAWSWTNIDDLLAGDRITNGFASKDNIRLPYLYQLWVEVDYTAGGGATVKPHYYYLQQ